MANFFLSLIQGLVAAVTKSPTGVSFVSLKGYVNAQGEKSNVLLNVGISYENAKKSDIEYLRNLNVSKVEISKENALKGVDVATLENARLELIKAFLKPDENRSQGQANGYTAICSGVKVHNETKEGFVWGLVVSKEVIVQGDYSAKKVVNSKPLTIAKDILRQQLKTGKFRQYNVNCMDGAKVNGETLVIE